MKKPTTLLDEATRLELAGPTLIVEDLYPSVKNKLTPEAVTLLENPTDQLIYEQIDVNGKHQLHRVNYFGYVVKQEEIQAAADRLADDINKLAELKYGKATLIKPSSFRLDISATTVAASVVFSYIAIDEDYQHLVESTFAHCVFKEGGLPPEFK